MKKHIKKIICLVAVLVLCVSAFVIPSFAYSDYDTDFQGSNVLNVTMYRILSDQWETDTIPLNNFDYFAEFGSNVIKYRGVDNSINANIPHCTFGFYNLSNNATYTMSIGDFGYFPGSDIGDVALIIDGDGTYFNYEVTEVYQDGTTVSDVRFFSVDLSGAFDTRFALVPSKTDSELLCTYVNIYNIVCTYNTTITLPFYPVGTEISDIPIYSLNIRNIRQNIYISDVPMGQFLWNSVTNFLSFEIVPGVSLYIVLTAVIALPLFIWFLKLFSGG